MKKDYAQLKKLANAAMIAGDSLIEDYCDEFLDAGNFPDDGFEQADYLREAVADLKEYFLEEDKDE